MIVSWRRGFGTRYVALLLILSTSLLLGACKRAAARRGPADGAGATGDRGPAETEAEDARVEESRPRRPGARRAQDVFERDYEPSSYQPADELTGAIPGEMAANALQSVRDAWLTSTDGDGPTMRLRRLLAHGGGTVTFGVQRVEAERPSGRAVIPYPGSVYSVLERRDDAESAGLPRFYVRLQGGDAKIVRLFLDDPADAEMVMDALESLGVTRGD